MTDAGGRRGSWADLARVYASRWTFLSIATLFYWVATQALRPYVALHLSDLGASELGVGVALAAHPFLSMVLAIPAGRYMDVRGLRRTMAVSLFAMATVGAGYALIGQVTPFIALQAAAGLAELGGWVGMQALITRVADPATRKRHLGLFSVTWAFGTAVGPTVGAFTFEAWNFTGVAVVYGLSAVAALACVLGVPFHDTGPVATPSRSAPRRGATFRRILEVLRGPGVAPTLAASSVMLFANNLRVTFYPLFLERAGVPVTTIGYLVSLAGTTLLLSRLPLPVLLGRYRSLSILMVGTATAAATVAMTPLIAASAAALWIAAALFGVGFGLNSPVTIDVIADGTDEGDRGLAMGMRVASNRLAQVIQPILFGAVAGPLGMAAGFASAGAVMGVTLGWAALRSRRRPGGATT